MLFSVAFSLTTSLQEMVLANLENTKAYWHDYVRTLSVWLSTPAPHRSTPLLTHSRFTDPV